MGWSHGFISQDGVMTDLNTLIPGDSNLFIIAASNINERGQISGMATVMSGPDEGKIHAILLTPVNEKIGDVGCRCRTYTPGFQFALGCLQPPFAEIRTRAESSDKGYFRSFRPCFPAICCAKAQGRRLCGTTWVTSIFDVTQNCQQRNGETLMFPVTPHSSYSHDRNLNHNLVHLLFCWFVGLGMDDAVWNHAVFSKNRCNISGSQTKRWKPSSVISVHNPAFRLR